MPSNIKETKKESEIMNEKKESTEKDTDNTEMEDNKKEEKEIEKKDATEVSEKEEVKDDKEVEEDWEAKYKVLQTEHQALIDKVTKEENTKMKEETFKKYGLKEENARLYHRLLENSEDVDKDMKTLMKEYPQHFGDTDSSINSSLPNKDFKKEDKETVDRSKMGMIG